MEPSQYTKEYIIQHADNVNWYAICLVAPLNLLYELSDDFSDMFNWIWVSDRMDLTADFIRKFSDKLSWSNICYFSKIEVLSSLVDEFSDQMSLEDLSIRVDFSYELYKIIEKKRSVHESN